MRDREALIADTAPFPDTLIEKWPPRGDSYVAGYQYAQRLLLVHPGYSWQVSNMVFANDVWAVAGWLTIDDVPYGAVGEADTPTSAESNAFKRACAKAGIGLHLYDEVGYWLHGRLVKGNGDE